MAFKQRAREAVPKIFQTFNSLLGGIVRKRNATIVGPSKQLVGEFPEVSFEQLYIYYHHWPQVKTAVDVMHQKFRGSGVDIKSNNEYFNKFIKKWWDVTNSEKKWSQFIYSLLITGSAIMELQYTPPEGNRKPRMGNIEQIPMQTIYRLFRDQFANELKIVQIVDGVFKELDPQFFIHQTINNPDRQAFGKSMFHTLASPRPVAGTVDQFTGEAINPERNSIPLLDAQVRIQNNQIEITDKMAKPRLIVGANGMSQEQMDEIQEEMADPNTSKYIWIFNKPVVSAELQIQAQGKFEDYTKGIDDQISMGTIFANMLITDPQGLSYSGGQAPLDILDQTMSDLQTELIETLKDRVLKPLAESWGFIDYEGMEVEISFIPTMKRLTMEDISGLDPEAVSKKEKREMYKKLNIPLDDTLWDAEQQELKQDKQDEKNIQMQAAMMGVSEDGEDGQPTGEKPFAPKDGGDDKPAPQQSKEPKDPVPSPFEADRPKPTPTAQPNRKPRGEVFRDSIIQKIAADESLTSTEKIEAIKSVERITLPPSATSQGNSSSDLYVSQGIDDVEGTPEITDPAIRKEFGLDEDKSELPPSAPIKMAHAGDTPQLAPADNANGRFTNSGDQGIPQVPMKSEDEYNQHLETANNGDEQTGGTGDDGITPDSDGSYKDPMDLNGDLENTPETPQANANPHPAPNQEPLVNNPDDLTLNVSGGSDPTDDSNDNILGSPDDDENPIVPSEGDPRDSKDKPFGEAVKPTIMEKPFRAEPNPVEDNRDIIEGEDPFTSGTGSEPTPELNNQPQKQQARLDDAPLQDPSANKGNVDGINPSRPANNTSQELPETLPNNDDESPNSMVPPFDKTSDTLGDSSQVRLKEEELTGQPQDPLLPNDSNSILDNTGLNVKPEIGFKQVNEDDYMKKVQDGSNPLEQKGEPLEDGMIIKPEDTQQVGGIDIGTFGSVGASPATPEGQTAIDQDPNTINDPTDSGIDEEEIDPNILHTDPKTGVNYTDLTDEQGNEVPDLRFDQTPSSDEEQPEVELEYEIVTQDEYDQHLDASKGQDPMNTMDPMTEDPMGMMNNEEPIPLGGDQPEDLLDPVETDVDGNPVPLETVDDNINDGITPPESEGSNSPAEGDGEEVPLGDSGSTSKKTPKKESPKKEEPESEPINIIEDENGDEEVEKIDDDFYDTDNNDKEESDDKAEGSRSAPASTGDDEKSTSSRSDDLPTGKSEKGDDNEKDSGEDKSQDEDDSDSKDEPKRQGTVKDIIKRERELIKDGVPDEELEGILEDEFGEKKIEKAKETKTWKKKHGEL